MQFQLDSGATCNVITTGTLDNLVDYNLSAIDQMLTMFNKTTVEPLGRCQVKMINPKLTLL